MLLWFRTRFRGGLYAMTGRRVWNVRETRQQDGEGGNRAHEEWRRKENGEQEQEQNRNKTGTGTGTGTRIGTETETEQATKNPA